MCVHNCSWYLQETSLCGTARDGRSALMLSWQKKLLFLVETIVQTTLYRRKSWHNQLQIWEGKGSDFFCDIRGGVSGPCNLLCHWVTVPPSFCCLISPLLGLFICKIHLIILVNFTEMSWSLIKVWKARQEPLAECSEEVVDMRHGHEEGK